MRTSLLPKHMAAVFAVLVMLASCTSFFSSDKKPKLSKDEQDKINEYKAEVELGRNMAGRLLHYYGVFEDEELLNYLNTVSDYVASYGDYPDRKYMVNILDSESVNAFACPGGYILITVGTLRLATNESELAMVLGHEIAHVGKKHMFNTLRGMNEKERDAAAKNVDAKGASKELESSAVRKREIAESNQTSALVARYLSGSTGIGLSLLQAAKAGMSLILEKGLDKQLEFEADSEGVRYAIRAGYDPHGLLKFLARLEEAKKKQKALDLNILDKTHPKIKDRKTNIEAVLDKMNATAMAGALGEQRFKKALAKLQATEVKKTK